MDFGKVWIMLQKRYLLKFNYFYLKNDAKINKKVFLWESFAEQN